MPLFGRGEDRRERSAADREAARLERERRRAQREGRPLPAEPAESALSDEAPPDEAVLPDEPLPEDPPRPDEPAPGATSRCPRTRRSATSRRRTIRPPAATRGTTRRPCTRMPPCTATTTSATTTSRAGRRSTTNPPTPSPRRSIPGARSAARARPAVAGPRARARAGARGPMREPADPQSTQPLEPVGAIHARRTVSLPRPQTEELGHHTDSWDRPIGNVRVSRGEYQAQPGAPGMPPHRNIGVQKTRRRWLRRFVVLLVILALAAVAVFAFMLYQPFHGKGYDAVVVKIPPGSSAGDIGKLLSSKGVVESSFFFALRARVDGDRGKLQAGTYTLKKSMPYKDALAALTQAPKAAPTIDVTLPEGPSRRELAPRVKAAGVRGSYVAASASSKLLRPRTYGAPKGTTSLEGFLFPDTYQLRSRTATAKALVNLQLRQFKSEFAKVDLKRARRKHLSRYDVLIIASMIEREAQVPKDRRLISAVIYNRLQQGIPLGIDATLRYRLNNWSKALRESELNINSDFNTRRRIGLPPTPIGNPGLASLQAAADPANAKYLFYVVKPCGNGAHAFSSTDAQFQKDVAAYNRARDKRGGKDPSHC